MIRSFVYVALTLALATTAIVVVLREGLVNVLHYPEDNERVITVVDILTTPDDVEEMTMALVKEAKGWLGDINHVLNSTLVQDITKVDETILTKSLMSGSDIIQIDFELKLTKADLGDIVFLYRAEETGVKIIETIDFSMWIPMSFVSTMRLPVDMKILETEYVQLLQQPDSLAQAKAKVRQFQNTINAHKHPAGVEMIFTDPFADTKWAFSNDELRTLKSHVSVYAVLLDMLINSLQHRQALKPADKQVLERAKTKRLEIQQAWTMAYTAVYNKRHEGLIVRRYRSQLWKEHWETPAFALLMLVAALCFWQAWAYPLSDIVIDELRSAKASDDKRNVRVVMRSVYRRYPRYLFLQPGKKSLETVVAELAQDVATQAKFKQFHAEAQEFWAEVEEKYKKPTLHGVYERIFRVHTPELCLQALNQLKTTYAAAVREDPPTPAQPKRSNGRVEEDPRGRSEFVGELAKAVGPKVKERPVQVRLKHLNVKQELKRLVDVVVPAINWVDAALVIKLLDRRDLKRLLASTSLLVLACEEPIDSTAIRAILDPPAVTATVPKAAPQEPLPQVLKGKRAAVVRSKHHSNPTWERRVSIALKDLGAEDCVFHDPISQSRFKETVREASPNTVFFLVVSWARHSADDVLVSSSRRFLRVRSPNAGSFQQAVIKWLANKSERK